MANLLKGGAVNTAIKEKLLQKVNALKEKGINPTLAILRVGEKESDLSYEKGTLKRCAELNVDVKQVILPETIDQDSFLKELDKLNKDDNIHGILMFRPLPKQIDNELARNSINPKKDVDGCTDLSLAGVFTNSDIGFAPCTAEAAMQILKYYNIDVKGKNVCVIGRSLVIGRPVAMLLMHQNATVTICHTKTQNIEEIASKADIIICATGKMETVGKNYVSKGQTIIDVGISWNEAKQKLCGDANFEEVEPIVENITPVPGGVGAVTTTILVKHVIEASER